MAVGCVMTLYYRPPINATMSSAATTAPTMMKMRSSLLPSDDLPPPPALAPVSLCSRYMTSCYYTITTCHQHTCKKQSFQNVLPTHTNRVLKVCLCDRYYTVCPLATNQARHVQYLRVLHDIHLTLIFKILVFRVKFPLHILYVHVHV